MQGFKIFLASEYLDETTLTDTICSVVTSDLCSEVKTGRIDDRKFNSLQGCVLLPCCSPQIDEEVLSGIAWESWNAETWLSSGGRRCHTTSCSQHLTIRNTECGLAERIHSLACKLPKYGAVLEVIWMVGDNTLPPVSEDLGLFGALKHLVEWHHGQVWIVPVSPIAENAPYLQEWVNFLRAAMLVPQCLDERLATVWNGSVSITGSKEIKPMNLHGFCLCVPPSESASRLRIEGQDTKNNTDDCQELWGNQMELIATVLQSQVPTYLYSGLKFELIVPSKCPSTETSKQFLQHLLDDFSLGYLMRLGWGTKWRAVNERGRKSKQNHGPQELDWKELIKDNLGNVSEPPCEYELDGNLGVLHFMLTGHSGGVHAHLLHPTERLNGEVGHILAKMELTGLSQGSSDGPGDGEKNVMDFLEQLPHFTGTSLMAQHNELERLQIETMNSWAVEHGAQITSDELVSLLSGVKKCYTEYLQKTGQITTGLPQCTAVCLLKPVPEDQLDCDSQLERLALHLREYHSSRLAKHKSSDSLAGLSPPAKGPVVTLDAREFLKLFTSEGTAVKQNLQVLVPKSRHGFIRFDNAEVVQTSWPNCLEAKYHGIHYNTGDKTEKLETSINKLRSRLVATETASTCTQAKAPTVMPLTPKPKAKDKKDKENDQEKDESSNQAQLTRSRRQKRKSGESGLTAEGKRLLAARKKRELQSSRSEKSSIDKVEASGQQTTSAGNAQAKAKTESRSQRHKRKLEEVVASTLQRNGLQPGDPIYDTCAKKLYTLTKVFIKDLTTWQSLREEMTKIAEDNVQQVIGFEKKRQEENSTK